MFKEIFAHMDSDPNANKHMDLGFVASMFCSLFLIAWTGSIDFFIAGFLVAPLFMGVGIELWQRVYRFFTKTKQNTTKESMLDAGVTTFWYLKSFRK